MENSSGKNLQPMATTFSQALFWGIVIALCAYGVFFIYSTGYIADEYPVRPNWWRQLIWLGFSAVVGFTIAATNPRGLAWRTFVWCGYGTSIVLLVLTLLFGRNIGGATRWLAIGPLLLQPAEFAKFFTLMLLCQTIVWRANGWRARIAKLIGLTIMLGLPLGLIIAAPSFGNAFSIIPSIICIFGIRYFNKKIWAVLVFLGVVSLLFSWHAVLELRKTSEANNAKAAAVQDTAQPKNASQPQHSKAKDLLTHLLHNYHSKRLQDYLTPRGGWNERQSIMTLASGGQFGKGYLQGTMKSLGYLPRTVAPTDFIFSVIGEEFGFFFGCLPVLLLYLLLFSIGFHWAGRTGDEQASLRSIAVLMMLAVHVCINVGMTVRLIPIIGLPLPLLSYGGSFTLTTFLCLGVLHATSLLAPADSETARSHDPRDNEWSIGRLLRIRVQSKE